MSISFHTFHMLLTTSFTFVVKAVHKNILNKYFNEKLNIRSGAQVAPLFLAEMQSHKLRITDTKDRTTFYKLLADRPTSYFSRE